MRAIDADHLRRWILSRVFKTQLSVADVVDQIDREDTIEPRCETCEVFNKTRLLIPQPQRTGRWIHDGRQFKGGIDWMHCSECGQKDKWDAVRTPFCAWCGARMEGEA